MTPSEPDATTQARLELTEAKLRAVVDTAVDAIVLANAHGDILQANRSAEQMFGRTNDDLMGRPLTVLMPERLRAAHRRGFDRFLAGSEAEVVGRMVELVGLRRDGREFPIELSLTACQSADGPIFTGIIRDITARREAEGELADQRAQLEAANKNLAAFSYSVSHDLRAPLRSIDGFSQVLVEACGTGLNEEGHDALRRIRAAVHRMERLIDAMLALSRVTRAELHRERIDLSAVASVVAADLHRADPGRAVEWVIHPDLSAHGDARLLRVVLENLLGNAWKATAAEPQGRIEVGACQDHDLPAFFVRDNGIGFDEAYAHKLFAALQSLHRQTEFPGTGIGLASVERIVARHGGTVWATGAPGHGAVFYFTLRGD